MLGFKYFQFLWLNIAKKKATWIVGIAYLFIIALLLFIVPFALNKTPFFLWTDAQVSVNLMVLYAAGLYSSILAIFIFREFNESGTELLIYSKPISRATITLYKFLCFVTFGLLFSLIAGILGLLVFLFPGVTVNDGMSLVLSLLTGNFILILVFGFLATIVTLYLNKVWTNLINICIVVIFMIFHMVSTFTVKTPSQLITEDAGLDLESFWYLDKNGEMKYGAQLSSREQYKTSDGTLIPFATKINNMDDVKKAYLGIDEKSKTETSNIFDIVQQFDSMFNVGSLESRKEKNAYESFGNNKWFNYKISDQSPVFQEDYPFAYVSNVATDAWDDPKTTILDIFGFELNETVKMLGNQKQSLSLSVFDDSDKMYVAKGYKGYTKTGQTNFYTSADLMFTSNEQKEWINTFLFGTKFDKTKPEDDFIGLLQRDNAFQDNKYYSSLYGRPQTGTLYDKYDGSFYNYIHDAVISTLGKSIFPEFNNSPTPANLAIAIIQLKFNIYMKVVEYLNNDCFLPNIDKSREFTNLINLINISGIPEADKNDLKKAQGAPLNPISSAEDAKYFTDPLARRGRALLDEYVTIKETFGYTGVESGMWTREKDHYVSMMTTFEMPLFKTYQNTFFNFKVKAVFSTGELWMAWGVISLLLMGIAITIYYRTDFK